MLLPLVIGFGMQAAGQSVPKYNNPILAGFYPDPSICRVDSNYYLVNSSFAYYPGLPVFQSTDLVSWKLLGHAMDRPGQLNTIGVHVSEGLFAPTIRYHKGVYYIVCTLIGKKGNFVITAKNAAGPWSDPVWLPGINGIDPSLFFDNNDSAYIVYNSVAPDNNPLWNGHRSIRMRGFNYHSLQLSGKEELIVNGGADIRQKPVWVEGPHLYHINEWYYLMCAEGGTGDRHSEVVFRSKAVDGPYLPYELNPILTQRQLDANRQAPITSSGHADLVETLDGKWYAVFLACRPYEKGYYNTGRETFLAPVTWTSDGWPVITKEKEAIQYSYPTPSGRAVKGNGAVPFTGSFTYRNNFSDTGLDKRFVFLRTVTEPWYNTTARKGFFRLQLRKENISGTGNPSFLGFRQQHHSFSATTCIEFEPKDSSDKAGLVIFQNEQHYYFLSKSLLNGLPVVQVFSSAGIGDRMQLLSTQYLPFRKKEIYLHIIQRGGQYVFAYSFDNKRWHNIHEADARLLSTADAGGFVGCVLGLYGITAETNRILDADFDWFEYTGR
ncbi:glycoside hydrolase family 43 protein [Filimonas zeae]|uniref:glycoside hydrolase family 43 protein n=1 Tax=Filimonas zeae TaxID=1737353 RepID=UPI0016672966|nr:glycoside hydrolase family 43 protein [Filimonas zeae]